MTEFEEMFRHVADFRARTIADMCESDEDHMMLASQLAFQAIVIYRHFGGNQLAAAQLYAMADKEASGTGPSHG